MPAVLLAKATIRSIFLPLGSNIVRAMKQIVLSHAKDNL
jgi:hypothetical protein